MAIFFESNFHNFVCDSAFHCTHGGLNGFITFGRNRWQSPRITFSPDSRKNALESSSGKATLLNLPCINRAELASHESRGEARPYFLCALEICHATDDVTCSVSARFSSLHDISSWCERVIVILCACIRFYLSPTLVQTIDITIVPELSMFASDSSFCSMFKAKFQVIVPEQW
jgi:hypothetical protein